MAVVILNKMYLGRYASLDELGRRPHAWQRRRLGQLRSFYVACGSSQDEFPLAPGRSGPELGACLRQLEVFLEKEVQLSSGYMDFKPFVLTKDDPDLFPGDEYPQLAPYKSLGVDRLKLVGTGQCPWRSSYQTVCCGYPFKSHASCFMVAPVVVLTCLLLQPNQERRIYDLPKYGMSKAC